ncbi:MAG: hypothetical protein ACE5I7_01560 [Candidatus Binatia bacterium]
MPSITGAEVAVMSAAVVLLFVAPALLALADERRRHKAPRRGPERTGTAAAGAVLEAANPDASDVRMSATLQPEVEAGGCAIQSPVAAAQVGPGPQPESKSAAPRMPPAASVPAPAEPGATGNTGALVGPAPIELRPLEGPARHCFHLQDLHPAHLPNWPPAAIRDDPERSRCWREAERIWERYHTAIHSAAIWSPYPARSSCLGAAELDGAKVCLRLFLFPVLWPVSQHQAVAQAVFEIDCVQGTVRGWVDALRASELTADNRRDISEAGGNV